MRSAVIAAWAARSSGYQPAVLNGVETSASFRSHLRMPDGGLQRYAAPKRVAEDIGLIETPTVLIKAAISSANNSKRSGRSISLVCPCPCNSTAMTCRVAASCGS